MAALVLLFILQALISTLNAEQICNGLAGLCRLRLNEVTLAGTHNSGAGFDSHLRYGSGALALSCFYRNQGASITGQLNLGIRYFDIDSCWNPDEKSAYACHKDAYGGSIQKILSQVDAWMKKNANEVVVLHFNRDYEKDGDPKKIGRDIIRRVKSLWDPTNARLKAKELAVQTNYLETLGRAIERNQRIYIFMHTDLSPGYERWIFSQHYVGYTWHSMSWITSNGCKSLANKVVENCDREARKGMSLIRLDLYLSYGLCIYDLASWCNQWIKMATEKCREKARKHGKTVNFILIDYANLGEGKKIKDVAKNENLKNIKYF